MKFSLALLPLAARGANLHLQGQGSNNVVFGHGMSEVKLEATCAGAATPTWLTVAPASVQRSAIESGSASTVELRLKDVAPTCVNAAISTPCASHVASVPPLFNCIWTGLGGTVTTGPFSASYNEYLTSSGVLLAVESVLSCGLPTATDFQSFGSPTSAFNVALNLSVTHSGINPPTQIAFAGIAAGDRVTMINPPPPPPPPSPSFPPPSPAPDSPSVLVAAGCATIDSYGGGWVFVNEASRSCTNINDLVAHTPGSYIVPSYDTMGDDFTEVLVLRTGSYWCDSWGQSTGHFYGTNPGGGAGNGGNGGWGGASMGIQTDNDYFHYFNNGNSGHRWVTRWLPATALRALPAGPPTAARMDAPRRQTIQKQMSASRRSRRTAPW